LTATRFLTWLTCAYLLLNLPVARLLGVPFTQWLALAFVCLVPLAVFARLERKRSKQGDELQQLIGILALEQRTWTLLERRWIGRTVRLKVIPRITFLGTDHSQMTLL
jgi:membrane protein implicated in regulation of membrane protease activity